MHPKTIAVHGQYHAVKPGDPTVSPYIGATSFRHPDSGLSQDHFSYTRHNNPNREQVEHTLAELEGGADAACFASGMAATEAVLRSLPPGSHVIYPKDVYHGTRVLLQHMSNRGELNISEADMRYPEKLPKLCTPHTRLLWLESPSNPMLHVTDISLVRDIIPKNVQICTDNTWLTPVFQNPLLFGSDLVVHSATKYLGGHSDLLGGVVVSKEKSEFFEHIRQHQRLGGGVLSAHDAYMLSRSLKTLFVRMKAHEENALKLAVFLQKLTKVTKVNYPGLPEHHGHLVSKKQTRGYGAMISFELEGDENYAKSIVQKSQIITPATSLGGVESTWEHRKSSEGPDSETPDTLIRLSVGLEHHEDLCTDIRRALE